MMFLIVLSPLLYPEFIAVLTRNLKEKIHSSKFFHQSQFHWQELTSPLIYMGADKSLARPGKKQATATEDFEFHISYL